MVPSHTEDRAGSRVRGLPAEGAAHERVGRSGRVANRGRVLNGSWQSRGRGSVVFRPQKGRSRMGKRYLSQPTTSSLGRAFLSGRNGSRFKSGVVSQSKSLSPMTDESVLIPGPSRGTWAGEARKADPVRAPSGSGETGQSHSDTAAAEQSSSRARGPRARHLRVQDERAGHGAYR